MTSSVPTQTISGAMHYFRTHPEQWATRLHWLRLIGLDTVETYVAWNLHEPVRGEFNFDGFGDLERFLRLASDEGLKAIVRPGPYICAEWENGGLPAWLTAAPGLRPRTCDPAYLDAVSTWFGELLPRLQPLLATCGGPVTMVQVENEYGSFGSDTAYLEFVRDLIVKHGIDVPLFTSDAPIDLMLKGGTVEGAAATVNFGSNPTRCFEALRAIRPQDAPFCMEWWNGWFDHWGAEHHTRDATEAALVLDEMLSMGASVNLYMAHGGTNFGFWAGANESPDLTSSPGSSRPTTTSYDYDAPLDERGAPTAKFFAYREVIARHREVPELEEFAEPILPVTNVTRVGPAVQLSRVFDAVSAAGVDVDASTPRSFEELGLWHGLVRYRTRLRGPRTTYPLRVDGLGDRAQLLVNGEQLHVFERNNQQSYDLAVPSEGLDLELVVESMGRVNYGRLIGERKGITGAVLHDRQEIHGWTMTPLSLAEVPRLEGIEGDDGRQGPAFHTFTFEATGPADTYVDLRDWGKGCAWLNGFGLGRYWAIGPQLSLYAPAPVLRAGANTLVVFEIEGVVGNPPTLQPAPAWKS